MALLAQVPQERLARLASDRKFLRRLERRRRRPARLPDQPALVPGARTGGWPAPAAVAYFSPEFGITAALPQYSGGLGILAGDHLKAASDLGVPLIGVGLLYRHGYFTQSLSAEGWQVERYPASDPNGLPLTLLRDAGGSPVADLGRAGRRRGAGRAGLDRPGRAGPAAAARLLRGGERAGHARGHRPALRRRHASTG